MNILQKLGIAISTVFLSVTGLFHSHAPITSTPLISVSTTTEPVIEVQSTTTAEVKSPTVPIVHKTPIVTKEKSQIVAPILQEVKPAIVPVVQQPAVVSATSTMTETERLRQIQIQQGIENDEMTKQTAEKHKELIDSQQQENNQITQSAIDSYNAEQRTYWQNQITLLNTNHDSDRQRVINTVINENEKNRQLNVIDNQYNKDYQSFTSKLDSFK